MLKNQTINIKTVEKIATALEEINDEVIYIGGAIVSLYANDLGADPPRPTKDIDISVQVGTYAQMKKLSERLAEKRIYPLPSESHMYKYHYDNIEIDIIPYDDTPLGPTNKWLKPGFDNPYSVNIGNVSIKILQINYYLATKWEAYKNRGNDPRTSHDFEDIIYLIDNNTELLNEIRKSEQNLKHYLMKMSNEILSHQSLNEIIECHLNPFTVKERSEIVINKLKEINALK
jgi:predicted nucleotidyltransferase